MKLNITNTFQAFFFIAQLLVFDFTLSAQFSPSPWRLIGVYHNNNILNDSVARIYYENRVGLIHVNGDTLVKPLYTNIFNSKNGYFIIYNSGSQIGLLNEKFQQVLGPDHSSIIILNEGIQVVKDEFIKYYDFSGNEKLDTFYSNYLISDSENGLFAVSKKLKKYGVMDDSSKSWVLQPEYHSIDISNPNFILASNQNGFQVFNPKGISLHKKSNQRIISWGEFFLVRASEHSPYFIYDADGKPFDKIPKLYGNVYCDDNLYHLSGNYRYLYDKNFNLLSEGVKVTKFNEKPLGNKSTNYHTSEKDQKVALHIDYKKVTPFKYSKLETSDSLIIGVHSAGIDILDNAGKVISEFKPNISFISGAKVFQVSTVSKDSVYFFDKNQFLKIPPYNELYFKNSLIATRLEKKWNILDLKGNILVAEAESVDFGLPYANGFIYTKNKLKGWYSPKGFLLPEYEQILIYKNGLFSALKNNVWKLYNISGTEFSPISFDKIVEHDYGLVCTTNENTFVLPKDKSEFISFQDFQYISKLFFTGKKDHKWAIYKADMTPMNNKSYENILINRQIIKSDDEYFMLNFSTDKIRYHDFDTMYYISDILIGKKNDSTAVFTMKGNSKNYVCDSIKLVMSYAAIYKDGKLTIMDYYNENPDIKDVDKLIYADHPHMEEIVVVKKTDVYEVYCLGKKILSLHDPDIKVEIKNSIISYSLAGKKYLYDVSKDSSYEKKYDLYKLAYSGNYIVENNFKYGLVDNNHKEIIPCKYGDYFSIINDTFVVVRNQSQMALYDLNGKLCIPLDNYDGSFTSNKNYIFAKLNNYYGYYYIKAKKWHPSSKYQDIKDCNIRIEGIGDIFIFVEKGKYGLMNEQCNVVLSPEYESIELSLNKFILSKNDKKSVIFVQRNMEKTSDYINFVTTSFENFWVGCSNHTFDLFYNDEFIRKFKGQNPNFLSYNYLSYISQSINGNDSIFIYDLKTNKIAYAGNQKIVNILSSERFIKEEKYGKYMLIDTKNNALIENSLDDYKSIKGKLLWVKIDGKQGVIDYNGKIIIEPKYDDFSNKINNWTDFLTLHSNQKIDVYDKNYKFIKSLDYDYMGTFSHNVAPIRKGSRWGFVDTSWNEVIPIVYDFCEGFYTPPVTFVYKDRKLEFIDPQGKPTLNPKNLSVVLNEMLGQIVASGNYNKENYDKIVCEEYYIKISDKLIFKDNETGKFGLMNPFYDIILPSYYDEIKRIETDFKHCFGYRINDKWGLLDANGSVLIEPTFERLEHDYFSKKLKVSIDGHSSLIDFPEK